ncbi:MAG: amino acid adenylation domain-containing protein, partial [Cellvibrio sp.]|uniref:non-ribosomal peptide synthetase n=1 Tax=Cellvibrio sp. TaxID=1965322 RepID=UPI00272235C8|nr:amino acid adenylation domain-containing protein [Cellvibrio sp.]
MDIDKLLAEINSAGVFLALKDGQLKSKAHPDAMTAELASQIKEHKSDIIRFLRSRENKPSLSKAPRNKPLMLSSAQQRMWFLQQLHTGSSLYNEPKVLKISGRLNVEALSNALKLIVERHEILRTCYYEEEGGVFGHVIPADDFEISISNGSVDRSIEYHQKTPFDLYRDYAMRAELVHAVDSYLLIICFHHVAVDGWSYNILIDELIKSYQSFNQGASPDFPVLPFQYADYASWERERQDDAALAYWQKRLADIVEYPLLLDKHCDNQHSDAGKSLRRRLPTATGTALKQLAKAQDVTVFSLLQTAFSYLLYRHQGHDESTVRDVVIGVPVANRDMKEVEQMVGLFVNSVVIRTTINPELSFIELLTEHKTNLLSDYQHQQMPFERLVDNLRPHRRLNRNPLFQTMIALREGQFKRLELEDLVIEQMDVSTSSARLDLTLIIEESDEEIIFVWEYASSLFDETTIDLIANRYEMLLEAVIRNPLVKLGNLPLVTEKEKAVLLSDWIGKQAEFCEDKCLHELFEAQVEKSPNAKAVTHEGQHLTYKELNEKANQLAHYLIQRGVVADSLVGICTEASFELIIGIMGILKAGGAYVPVDPSNPEARIKRMLEDSGVTLLLTQSCLKDSLSIKDLEAVCLDDSSFNKRLKIFSDHNIASSSLGIEANNLAYVIYTSGSTGHPKGVMVERRGLRNLVQWYSREYGLSSTDVALIPSSIGFDLTQKNLFSMLAVGGRLVFPARGSYDPVELLSAIKSYGVTCINCAPSMFYGVIGNAQANNFFDLQTLRYVFFGGETINRSLLTEWLSDTSCSAEIINMYGPTECTDIVTSHTLAQGSDTTIIGRSIPNVSTYVLNAQKELQHIGGCGELYIGGLGLSRGYLNNPTLTAERFIPNPFHDPHNQASSARLYRTGD